MSLKMELLKRFGIDGNGELADSDLFCRNTKAVTVKEFEIWSGANLDNRVVNEYGSEDCKITLIDENCEDFEMNLEINNEIITHSYF